MKVILVETNFSLSEMEPLKKAFEGIIQSPDLALKRITAGVVLRIRGGQKRMKKGDRR